MSKKLNDLDLLPYIDAEERVTFGTTITITSTTITTITTTTIITTTIITITTTNIIITTTIGSYGTIFMDDSKRLDSDIERVLKRNEEDGIRTNIHTPLIGTTTTTTTTTNTTNTSNTTNTTNTNTTTNTKMMRKKYND